MQLEFVQNKTSKEPFDPVLGVALAVHNEGIAQGIMMYPGTGGADGKKGDHIMISPPYNITEENLEVIVAGARKVVDTALRKITDVAPSPRM